MIHRNCNQRMAQWYTITTFGGCCHRYEGGRKCCCDCDSVSLPSLLGWPLLIQGPGRYWDDWQFPVWSRHIDISSGLSCLTIYTISGYPASSDQQSLGVIYNRNVLSYFDTDWLVKSMITLSILEGMWEFYFLHSALVCKSFYKENVTLKNLAWIIPMKIIIRYNAFSHYTNILSDRIFTYNSL